MKFFNCAGNSLLPKIFLFALILFSFRLTAQEICDNSVDDDNDFLVDLNDTAECVCQGINGLTGAAPPSLFPNPSFEEMDCCPSWHSEMDCAAGWIQATDATSDYFNTCDYVFQAITDAGLLPFPDGNGAVGELFLSNWKEYVGACLTQPLLAGNIYQISFNMAFTTIDGNGYSCLTPLTFSPTEIVLFGNTDCSQLPVSTEDCPSSADARWMVLGNVSYTPASSWSVVTITFTPTVDIYAVMLGPPCTLPPDYPDNNYSSSIVCWPYMVFDNLILNQASLFSSISIRTVGNLCTNDLTLTAHIDTTRGAWQWFQNGVAIPGETDSSFQLSAKGFGAGIYTVRYSLDTMCLSATYNLSIPHLTLSATGNICDDNLTINAAADVAGGAWQWYRNDIALAGETNAQINIPSTATAEDIYKVKYEAGGCDSASWSLFVPTVSISEEGKYCSKNLVLNAAADSAGGTWQWYFDEELPGDTSSFLNISALEYPLGEYHVKYTLGSACATAYDTPDSCDCNVVAPQAFVPDGSGLNRVFKAFSECHHKITSFDLKVFNRWGEVVFHANEFTAAWDGTHKGKPQDTGVFVYQIITHFEGEQQPRFYNGNVTLIR